jgi:hypothetical protein
MIPWAQAALRLRSDEIELGYLDAAETQVPPPPDLDIPAEQARWRAEYARHLLELRDLVDARLALIPPPPEVPERVLDCTTRGSGA